MRGREWKLQGFWRSGLRNACHHFSHILWAKARPEASPGSWGGELRSLIAGDTGTGRGEDLYAFSGLSKVAGTPQDAGPLSTETLSPTLGTVCDFRLSYGRVLSRSSKIIIVNRNRKEMLMNSDMFWKPQEAVQGKPLAAPSHMYSFRFLSSWPLLQLA